MTWEDLKRKLSSRKFLVTLISVIAGLLGLFGANDAVVQLVSSVGLILVPAIVYIVTEGKIDAAAAQIDFDALLEAIKEYLKEEE